MPGRLEGKVAVITGAGQGIGEATAEAFASEGASIVIAEKNAKTGAAVAARLSEAGARTLFIETDVADQANVNAMAEQASKTFGPVTVLINNAGIAVMQEPLALTQEEWSRCFAVDLDGCWYCMRAVLPMMLEAGIGSVVNIASVHSFNIIPNCFPYPVAKHALIGLTRSLGIQYAAQNIRVNAIAPGYIYTPINDWYWSTFPDPEAEKKRAFDLHPPKRIGEPREVAMTALFLASDEAPFINAECIVIDGGRSVLYHE
jgi:NAD(P)-dependent dehydrogenase (short-subunit alcohol dehydrogenase family)